MRQLIVKLKHIPKKYPITRGIISYVVLWPTSNIIQQTIAGKRWSNYDWKEALRYSIYGGFYVAPTLYLWVRFSSLMWPATNLRFAMKKAVIEQFTYGPFANVSFFFVMSLMELKTFQEAKDEVKNKFIPTMKIGVCVWPIIQTINFSLIAEHNRVPFTSVCSLIWTCFLAYMKHLDNDNANANIPIKHV